MGFKYVSLVILYSTGMGNTKGINTYSRIYLSVNAAFHQRKLSRNFQYRQVCKFSGKNICMATFSITVDILYIQILICNSCINSTRITWICCMEIIKLRLAFLRVPYIGTSLQTYSMGCNSTFLNGRSLDLQSKSQVQHCLPGLCMYRVTVQNHMS